MSLLFFDRKRGAKVRASEFWPDWIWHTTLFLQGALLGFLRGGLNWFVRVNPGIAWGGMFDAPKSTVLAQLRTENQPKSAFISYNGELPSLPSGFSFPVVVKPDAGERGRSVHKLLDINEWRSCWPSLPKGGYLVQDFVANRFEFGVFVIRDEHGQFKIHSLCWKLPLGIVGDGIHTLGELLPKHARASRFRRFWPELDKNTLQNIPADGAWYPLHFSGNHSRGAAFFDARSFISNEMEAAFNQLLLLLQGFDYGRLDVLVTHPDDLLHAEKIIVLEVNGANSEPAHVYDPAASWWTGLLEHHRFQRLMWKVACRNLKAGAHAPSVWETWKALRDYQSWQKSIL